MRRINFWFWLCLLFFVAGTLYALAGQKEIAAAPAPAQRLEFVHPAFGYSLFLPASWRGQLWARESGPETIFEQNGRPVFAVRHKEGNEPVRGQRLAEEFYLIDLSGLKSPDWTREKGLIVSSFRSAPADLNQRLRLALAGEGSSTLPVVAWEILLTEEKASSTVYYLSRLEKIFTWTGVEPSEKTIRGLAKVELARTGEVLAVQKFDEREKAAILEKSFPAAVLDSPVIRAETLEQAALREKLEEIANREAALYFIGQSAGF